MFRTLNVYAHGPAWQILLYVIFARRGHFVWYVWSGFTWALEDLGIRPRLKVFWIFPPNLSPFPFLPLPSSSPPLPDVHPLELRKGLMGLAKILKQALSESQTALVMWFPFFSCPYFPVFWALLLCLIPLKSRINIKIAHMVHWSTYNEIIVALVTRCNFLKKI